MAEMQVGSYAALGAMLFLGACGGGGSAPPTGGSGPSPAPSPSPPPVTYTAYDDLTGSQTFPSACAAVRFENGHAIALPAQNYGDGLTFETVDNATWQITGDTYELEFNENDLRPNSTDLISIYVRQIASLALQIYVFSKPNNEGSVARYVRKGSISAQRFDGTHRQYECAFGVPTDPNDLFAARTYQFDGYSASAFAFVKRSDGSTEEYLLDRSAVRLRVVRQSALEVTLNLRGQRVNAPDGTNGDPVAFDTITGQAALGRAPAAFRGDLVNADNAAIGSFSGQFFGPRAGEIGVAYNTTFFLADGAEVVVNGSVFGL